MIPSLPLRFCFLVLLFTAGCGMFDELPNFQETYCQQDEYVRDNFCTPCPQGTTNAAGDAAGGDEDTTCDPVGCAINQQVRSNRCFDCPIGFTAAAGADASGPDTTCVPTFCKVDQHVQDNACVVCTMSTSNAAGDPAAGPDTACDGMLCLEDQSVLLNTCVDCAPGTTAAPGADASGADTQCTPVICPANQSVSSNTCVPCAPGSQRDAGDDASGADTSCNPVLCKVNQRVQDHACVPCDGTDLNEPGDDTSGADTSCKPFAYKEVETGYTHTCALTVIGGLECWGSNKYGQLGNGTGFDSLTPSKVIGLSSGVIQVSAGLNHTCAVLQNETMRCWGVDMLAEFGASPKTYLVPTDFDVAGKSIKQVSVGGSHSCATTADGEAWCWGASALGRLGSDKIPPEFAGFSKSPPVKVTGLSNVRKVGVSSNMSCAVTDDDEMYCWGGAGGTLIKSDEVIVSVPERITGIGESIRDFAIGLSHVCVVKKAENNLLCWGSNAFGELGDGTRNDQPLPDGRPPRSPYIRADQLVAAGYTTCKLYRNVISCWGSGDGGQLGNGSTENILRADSFPLLEKENPIHLSLGSNNSLKTSYACAVTGSGRIKCWGNNEFGKLGDGTTEDRLTPVDVKF